MKCRHFSSELTHTFLDLTEGNDLEYILILLWNIAPEVREQHKILLDNRTKFATVIPDLKII